MVAKVAYRPNGESNDLPELVDICTNKSLHGARSAAELVQRELWELALRNLIEVREQADQAIAALKEMGYEPKVK